MNKRWTALLLSVAIALSAALTVFAAEDTDAGFYNIGYADRVEITPVTADGQTVTAVFRDVDGEYGDERFYPGSKSLQVTISDTAPGKMYILTVAEGDTVYYADQQTGGGVICFHVTFLLPEQQTNMLLSIGSNAEGFTKLSIPLSYTPKAEADHWDTGMKAGYLYCLRDSSCVMAAYSDLDRSAWYHDGVHWALENEIMNGYDDGRFGPNDATSRAMIVTMLHRFEGEPAVDYDMDFTDVEDGKWYTEAIRWAAANGIVTGYGDGKLGPEDELTREQLATILYRYAKIKGQGFTDMWAFPLTFDDASDVSDWAYEAMCWMTMNGVINGAGDNRLSPKGSATRAQVATMLMRYTAIEQ